MKVRVNGILCEVLEGSRIDFEKCEGIDQFGNKGKNESEMATFTLKFSPILMEKWRDIADALTECALDGHGVVNVEIN